MKHLHDSFLTFFSVNKVIMCWFWSVIDAVIISFLKVYDNHKTVFCLRHV